MKPTTFFIPLLFVSAHLGYRGRLSLCAYRIECVRPVLSNSFITFQSLSLNTRNQTSEVTPGDLLSLSDRCHKFLIRTPALLRLTESHPCLQLSRKGERAFEKKIIPKMTFALQVSVWCFQMRISTVKQLKAIWWEVNRCLRAPRISQ